MKAIQTNHPLPPLTKAEELWLYCALDCCVTSEVLTKIRPQLDNLTRSTYEFSKALQAPVLEMRLRGVLIDAEQRNKVVADLRANMSRMARNLDRLIGEGIGVPDLNWRSPKQLMRLFYHVLGIPTIRKRNAAGLYAPTVNRDALEQLDNYFLAQPLVSHILGLRDLGKKVEFLETGIDPDGRIRTSYNIAGTSTGRFASSSFDFGTGTNLQNVEDRLRSVFVADQGCKFAYIDLEQAESRAVGAIEWNLFHDGKYLNACESGDLHTSVARLAWPHLHWTGRLAEDKAVAEQPYYRQHSYRHMAKVLGHGTNYLGKPTTMAKHTHIDAKDIASFQFAYFSAFPAHRAWHRNVAAQIAEYGNLISLSGRRRYFLGRRNDDATIREAVAFDPQCTVSDILNRGMLQVWRLGICQLLLQVHDAILVQYPEEQENEILPKLLRGILAPIELKHGRTLVIPSEASVGWNWAKASKSNPDGLLKWSGNDQRRRGRKAPTELDLILCAAD